MTAATLVVTGSEAAAACGVDPFRSPVQLWSEKLGLSVPREDSEAMRWGTLLQPLIAEEVEQRGYAVMPAPKDVVTNDDYPFLSDHPDGLCYRPDDEPRFDGGVLEIKTTSPWRREEWADDQIPPHVYVQGMVYLMLTERRWCLAACLIGGQRLFVREFEYDPEMAGVIADRTKAFLRCVEEQVPPPPRHDDGDVLSRLYPEGTGEVIELTADHYRAAVEYEKLRAQEKEVGEQKDALGNQLRVALGSASAGVFEGRRVVSLTDVQRKGYSVEPKRYRQLRVKS